MKKENNAITTIENNAITFLGNEPIINGLDQVEVNGKLTTVYKDTYTDKAGNLCTFTCADEKMVKWLSACRVNAEIDKRLAMVKYYAYYQTMEHYKEFGQFTSGGDFAETVYSVKAETARMYAEVGKYFLKEDEKGNVVYVNDLLNGASGTNLCQILSLVEKDSDEPIAKILDYIVKGKLHVTGTLAIVKRDIHDIKTDLGTIRKPNKDSNKKGNKDGNKDDKLTIADAFKIILETADAMEDDEKKTEITELVSKLQSMF